MSEEAVESAVRAAAKNIIIIFLKMRKAKCGITIKLPEVVAHFGCKMVAAKKRVTFTKLSASCTSDVGSTFRVPSQHCSILMVPVKKRSHSLLTVDL